MGNYQVTAQSLMETFDTVGDFTAGGTGGGAMAAETTIKQEGSASLKFTAPISGNYFGTKTINLDLSRAGIFSVDVYVTDTANTSTVTIYLSNDSGFTNYFSRSISGLTLGWNRVLIWKNWWSETGSPVWTSNMVRLRVRTDSTAAGTSIVYFDNIKYGGYNRPKIIWIADDGWDSVYSVMYDALKTYGLKGTAAIVSSYIDQASRLTTANLATLHTAGWDIVNHTSDHTNLTTLGTQAEMETKISTCSSFISGLGYTRNNEHKMFVFPNGGYNTTVLAALSAQGMKAARTIVSQSGLYSAHSALNPLLLVTHNLGETTVLATLEAEIDKAIAAGGVIILESHKFVPTPSGSTEFLDTDTYLLAAYIAKLVNGGLIDMVTLSEWYEGLTRNRKLA